jgi:hypothetical protein
MQLEQKALISTIPKKLDFQRLDWMIPQVISDRCDRPVKEAQYLLPSGLEFARIQQSR